MVFVAGVVGSTGVTGLTGVVGVTVVVMLSLSHKLSPFPMIAVLGGFFVPVVLLTGSGIGSPAKSYPSPPYKPMTGAPKSMVPFLT